jgi:hypothetical protein
LSFSNVSLAGLPERTGAAAGVVGWVSAIALVCNEN